MKTTFTPHQYKQRFGKKERPVKRNGCASQFENIVCSLIPTIICKIDNYDVIFDNTTTDKKCGYTEFAGMKWKLEERELCGCSLSTALNIIKDALEIHLPEERLGRAFLGNPITSVSISVMCMHEMWQ